MAIPSIICVYIICGLLSLPAGTLAPAGIFGWHITWWILHIAQCASAGKEIGQGITMGYI